MMDAILLGAGLSKRMGRQKLLLPFGGKTVIETVIDNMRGAGFRPLARGRGGASAAAARRRGAGQRSAGARTVELARHRP